MSDNYNQRIEKVERMTAPLSKGEIIVLNDANFYSQILKHEMMVVDFWAPWCGTCTQVSPVIEELAREYSGKVAFGKLNVDDNPLISDTYCIDNIPAILMFKRGRQVGQLVGEVQKAYIESKLKQSLENESDYQ